MINCIFFIGQKQIWYLNKAEELFCLLMLSNLQFDTKDGFVQKLILFRDTHRLPCS